MEQSLMDKLTILADSAKYDVACTSSGASRAARTGSIGSCYAPGCCHAFTADGRCVSLLKVLMTNCCSFDCSYCVNRKSNDLPRATFSPRELAELTMEFYRRNYIEGLFLSSAVLGTPDYTTERMLAALRLLRFYQFKADEILDEANQSFNPYLDPKCNWAVQHYGLFPVDVNRAPFEMLLRVPGIGPKSARRIWHARKLSSLGLDELKRMGVVLKRAQYFITCNGFAGAHPGRGTAGRERITQALIDPNVFGGSCEQLSLFTPPAVDDLITQGVAPRAAMRMVREEAVQCLAKAL